MASNVVTTLGQIPNTAAEKFLLGKNDWTALHTNTHGALSAAVAALAGVQHFLKRITLSYSAAPAISTLTVKDGTTVIWQAEISASAPFVYDFDFSDGPLQATEGAALSVNVGDAGAGIVQTITAVGFSSTSVTAFT